MALSPMSPKERIMTALRGGQPDRVPAAPDISIMVPIRLSGSRFHDVELHNRPSVTSAYIRAARYFDMEGWLFNGTLDFKLQSPITGDNRIVREGDGFAVYGVLHTPDGDLTSKSIHPPDNPGTCVERLVKDFKADFKKLRHLYSPVVGCDASLYRAQHAEMGDRGVVCCFIDPPGYQIYNSWMDLESLVCAHADEPDLFDELVALHEKQAVQKMEFALDAKVESILTGGSGSITLQSPDLFRRLTLPTLKRITKMAREAGTLIGVHSCGKEFDVARMCAEETDLNYLNPLEIPPMGDCRLADVKARFGGRLALMGNLHTTDVMLKGTPDLVRLRSLEAIRDAGGGGGFVLSTGDQCGRDTPFENLFALVETAKEFGRYPLDGARIDAEIARLAARCEEREQAAS